MSTTTVEQAIENADRTFETTFGNEDADGMANLYTADGQLLPAGTDAISGKENIAAFWQSLFDMGITQAELEAVEVDDHDDTAIEVGRYTLSDADDELVDRGKYVVVWKREGGEWKLHRDIWNTSLAED